MTAYYVYCGKPDEKQEEWKEDEEDEFCIQKRVFLMES
jgi:hypothetical protein